MKFIRILIFSFIQYVLNYYNNYLKNRFLRNYGPMVEMAGYRYISFFLLKNSLK